MIEDLNVADIPLLVPLSFPFIVSADRAVETLCFFIMSFWVGLDNDRTEGSLLVGRFSAVFSYN